MWWPWNRPLVSASDPNGSRATVETLLKIIEDLRDENRALHNRLVAMHGYGEQEQRRALSEREAHGKTLIEAEKKLAEEGKLPELDAILARDPYDEPKPEALEHFPAAVRTMADR